MCGVRTHKQSPCIPLQLAHSWLPPIPSAVLYQLQILGLLALVCLFYSIFPETSELHEEITVWRNQLLRLNLVLCWGLMFVLLDCRTNGVSYCLQLLVVSCLVRSSRPPLPHIKMCSKDPLARHNGHVGE